MPEAGNAQRGQIVFRKALWRRSRHLTAPGSPRENVTPIHTSRIHSTEFEAVLGFSEPALFSSGTRARADEEPPDAKVLAHRANPLAPRVRRSLLPIGTRLALALDDLVRADRTETWAEPSMASVSADVQP